MRVFHISSLALFALAACVVAPHMAFAAWPHAPNVNLRVTGADHDQQGARAVTDGAGGVLIVWSDERDTTNVDIYAQHILRSGVIDPTWPVNGLPVCTAIGSQLDPELMADGAGGAIAVWRDNRGVVDLYAQRILPGGGVDPTWPVNGVAVSTSSGSQWDPSLASDGAGGVLVAFSDNGGVGGCDVRVQHVLASGVADPVWPVNGRFLCLVPDCQDDPSIVADGAGGAIVAWGDARDGVQFDIYATRVLADGTLDPAWPANGRAVCTAVDNQYYPSAVSDGAGGAIVAWEDWRPHISSDIYAMRVLPDGTLGAGWPANGRVLCAASEPQEAPLTVPDGGGGAIAAWFDSRTFSHKPYGQRVTGAGAVPSGWVASGRLLSVEAGDTDYNKDDPVIVSDGAGGAIVAWQDDRGNVTQSDIGAQHLLSTGDLDPSWPAAGVVVCNATRRQIDPTITTDGAGGAIVAWTDWRDAGIPKRGTDVYAQRIDRHGKLGSAEPEVASVADVPTDQGGHVAVAWSGSYLESAPYLVVTSYKVFRSNVPSPYVWQELGTVAASGASGYAFDAPTTGDSTAAGAADAAFRIEACSASDLRWASLPVSGHSVDNLPPGRPSAFTANYVAGTAMLHWLPNTEADLNGYRLYRGETASFPPDGAHLIATPVDTGYADPMGAPHSYLLTAVDVHGNESAVASVTPTPPVGTDEGGRPDRLELSLTPNPTVADATLRLAFPRPGRVRLDVYDVGGRRLRTLMDGAREAGRESIPWDLRDDRGQRVNPGLYFVRVEAGGEMRFRRLAVGR